MAEPGGENKEYLREALDRLCSRATFLLRLAR